jgi:hypothetical protein
LSGDSGWTWVQDRLGERGVVFGERLDHQPKRDRRELARRPTG